MSVQKDGTMVFRLIMNAIGLASMTYMFAKAVQTNSDSMPFLAASFVVMAFGCVLSGIDYAKAT